MQTLKARATNSIEVQTAPAVTTNTFANTAGESIQALNAGKNTVVDLITIVRNPSVGQGHKGRVQMSPNPLEPQPLLTPVRPEILNDYLEGYPQEQRLDCFKNGFRLNFSGER